MNDKKRRIGHSMKPREAVDSTAIDSQEPENTPDLGSAEGSESVVPLEGELVDLGEKEAENVENDEIAQPRSEVANEVETPSKEVEKEENAQPSSLEEMLAASALTYDDITEVTLQNLASERKPQHFQVLKEIDPHPFVFKDGVRGLRPGDIIETIPLLGQQPDGSYKLVVAIPEGYIEGVKTQAELDNMTPEEWVSFRLAEYFEQWWFAQGQSK